jgi:transposase-like protein
MTFVTVHCPHCDSEQIVKRGKTRRGTQRYLALQEHLTVNLR